MKRGEIFICNLSGDFGKPRPGVIVQSNLFNATHASVVICPITSHIINAPLFRITLNPNTKNGLKNNSQVMIDKVTAIKVENVKQKIGFINRAEMDKIDEALKLWLDLR